MTQATEEGRLMTEKEAAEYLHQKVKTLQARRVSGGGAPFVKLGRSVRYRLSDLQQFVAANVRTSTAAAKHNS
jgi:excisionase family DNA binding protein